MRERITDLDIPLAYRTQANFWKAKYFEAYKELVKANKGIRRLKRKLAHLSAPKRCHVCGVMIGERHKSICSVGNGVYRE